MWNCFPFRCFQKTGQPKEELSTVTHHTAVENSKTGRSVERRSLIWRFRRFMAKRRQHRHGETDVTHLIRESMKDSLSCVDLTIFTQASDNTFAKKFASNVVEDQQVCLNPKCTKMQASTSELLSCFAEFICGSCHQLNNLSPTDIILWMTSIDDSLTRCWQEEGFINPANVVFLYMLCREFNLSELDSEQDLLAFLSTCLYISYAYVGSEISYPMKPFLVESSKEDFWSRCLYIINFMSSKMLRFHADHHYFIQIFVDLKAEGEQESSIV